MSVNKVFLIGRFGRDPKIKHGQSAFCTFTLATSEKWKGQDGNINEKTEWHNCIAFGKTAELISNYCRKGSQVYLEGKITTSKKDDKYFTNIQVQTVQFLDKKESQEQGFGNQSFSSQNTYEAPKVQDSFYDEIPF